MSYSDKVIDIREINKKFSLLLPESGLRLVPKENSNGFLVGGNTSSQAINNYDNEPKEVNVFNLFNDFWIYIDINLIFDNSSRSNFPNIFVSISIFQGDGSDPIKNQLFRAEWDNYRDLKQEHPQPHWHIYPVQYHHKTFNDYLEATKEWADFLSDDQSNIVEIKKIHFAMNAQWSDNGSHIHEINDQETLFNWILGLLKNIKFQLEYAS